MASRSSSASSERRLALALLVLAAGCGEGARELSFSVSGAATCGVTCTIQAVDVYVLTPRGSGWCLAGTRSFVPEGERTLEGLELVAGTTVRLVILGYCGSKCECRYDDRVVVDPAAGSLTAKLNRDPFCEKPLYSSCD